MGYAGIVAGEPVTNIVDCNYEDNFTAESISRRLAPTEVVGTHRLIDGVRGGARLLAMQVKRCLQKREGYLFVVVTPVSDKTISMDVAWKEQD